MIKVPWNAGRDSNNMKEHITSYFLFVDHRNLKQKIKCLKVKLLFNWFSARYSVFFPCLFCYANRNLFFMTFHFRRQIINLFTELNWKLECFFFRRGSKRDWRKCANAATIQEISPFGIFLWTLHSKAQTRTDVSDVSAKIIFIIYLIKNETYAKL